MTVPKNKYYQYYQPNKKDMKDKYGDCVIRALTKVLDMSWMEVFNDMLPVCTEYQALHNNQIVYTEYLKSKGFIYVGISNKKGTKRPAVKSFAKDHKYGTYFITVANHVVAIVDGCYYDTWDSGEKSIYGYWKKE
jgi:hypothetical protein